MNLQVTNTCVSFLISTQLAFLYNVIPYGLRLLYSYFRIKSSQPSLVQASLALFLLLPISFTTYAKSTLHVAFPIMSLVGYW